MNLLKSKIMVANKSMREKLNTYLLQTQNFRDSKDFLSLDNLIEDVAGASQSVVGGIARATYTWWRNKYKAASLTAVTSEFRTFYNDVTQEWNVLVQSVPTVLVARLFGHGVRAHFARDESQD